MVRHRRTPGVEHGGDADAGAEMLPICRDGQHCLRRCLEQQVVDRRLVVEGDVGDLGGQREHDVEVADRQQVGLTLGKPFPRRGTLALRTVPVAAGVIGDAPLAAVLAGLDVTAKGRGAAVLDRRHDLELGEAQMPGVGGPVGGPCSAEDVANLDRGAHAQPSGEISSGLKRPSLSSGLVTVRTVRVATLV